MSLLYHVTSPWPRVPGTDAVFQDVEALRARFGGEILPLYPFRHPGRPWPRALFGLGALRALRRREESISLHHVFAAGAYRFPFLRGLRRPVIQTVVASVQGQAPPKPGRLDRLACLVASSERDIALLRGWGLDRVRLILPGIELARIRPTPPPGGSGFRLLVGSAPWVRAQFRSKGVDALLEAAVRVPELRLVFLWRGHLRRDLDRRVRARGLCDRVEVLDGPTDVNAVLSRVHAAVVLASGPRLVKAYPHSLLEALAAGRPVLVSEAIPMADYVREAECGEVVAGLRPSLVLDGVRRLIEAYAGRAAHARASGARGFSRQRMLDAYGRLYRDVEGAGPAGGR
jgi:glycosyltransferase involved in cell wall biosynthesis